MSTPKSGPDDLVVPFVFVPNDRPEPKEWLAQHPGAIKIPARLVRKDDAEPGSSLQADLNRLFQEQAVYAAAAEALENREPPTSPARKIYAEAPAQTDPSEKDLRAMDALPNYLRPVTAMQPAGPGEMAGTKPTAMPASFDTHQPVKRVGHSWGGDTATEVAKDRPQTLTPPDPVGAGASKFLDSVADHARRWIGVTSEGGGADAGEIAKYTEEFMRSKHPHRDFDGMMDKKDPVTGHAVADALPAPK